MGHNTHKSAIAIEMLASSLGLDECEIMEALRKTNILTIDKRNSIYQVFRDEDDA